jgi:hypothetical protein
VKKNIFVWLATWWWLMVAAGSVVAVGPISQVVVYEAPKWGTNGVNLTAAEVTEKMGMVIYARNQMIGNLENYRAAGFKGKSLVYLIADEVFGPSGMSAVADQTKSCTNNIAVLSNNATMDAGDFCKIHNAILSKTAIAYGIVPTENWFLHRADGSRINKNYSSVVDEYQPNPADPGWQKFLAMRALRELNGESGHSASGSNLTGIFLDNVGLSWNKVVREGGTPKEFANSEAYAQAAVTEVAAVIKVLTENGNSYQLWANMIEDPHTGTTWDKFKSYLDGGMMESFGLSWGKGPLPAATVVNDLTQAQSWINAGKGYVMVIQGDNLMTKDDYTYGLAMLVTSGTNMFYKYANYSGHYNEYYEGGNYKKDWGGPISAMVKNGNVYSRQLSNGTVTVDVGNQTVVWTENSGPIVTATRIPPSPTATADKAGDANGDGKVDLADFAIWKSEYLDKLGIKSDFNNSGIVDLADFAVWKGEYLN